MSDNVLDYLREQFARVNAKLDRLASDVSDLKVRMTSVEAQTGSLLATEAGHYAVTMQRLDRVDGRLDRIERRLDLAEAGA
jgi:hypothetical protein